MEAVLDHWGPSLAVFLPLVGAALMMLIPKVEEDLHKVIALVTSLAVFVVTVGIAWFFDYDNSGQLQYVLDKKWIPVINSRYIVGVDGISLPLLLLTVFIVPLVIIYSWNHWPEPKNPKAFLILTLILETGMVGSFLAQDLILFFVFFEVVLLPMYFMIGVWGGEQRMYAAIKFFLFTLFGSALMIVSFLALYFLSDPINGLHTFDMRALPDLTGGIAHGSQLLIFGGMFMGFGIKVPIFPFHTWLPDAHTQAPTQGSVILAAVLLKLGTYGFIRIAIPILPDAAHSWAPYIAALASVGIIYGALCCLAQTDMKRLIAFSSVAHMGYVMLGISTLTSFGLNAAVMGMVAHGLITGMLFFLAGSVKERFHTLEIKRLGGLLISMPKLGWILGFCTMASLGLPGLAGFWGEFPAILASYQPAEGLPIELFRFFMVVAAIGTVLAAGYLLWLLQRTAFGTPNEEWEGHDFHDVETTEWLAWAPLLVGIVVIGLYPNFIFHITDGGVTQALHGVSMLAFGK
jgi:NADH-quinone oxidoreductase subunit M